MKFFVILTLILVVMFGLVGCENKEVTGSGEGRLNVYLTDSPAGVEAVNIVIREVEVNNQTDGWITINNSVRSYNLLSLTNGAWELLGTSKLKAGHYTQIRLILDNSSSIVVNGTSYPLDVPSGEQTGIKLIHDFTIQEDYTYEIVLDFDVQRSINQRGNGDYYMKPVIRARAVGATGVMLGFVSPTSTKASVIAISSTDTSSTYADSLTGLFKLIALYPGSYGVRITPADTTYRDTTLANVTVNAGQTTNVGTIALSLK